MASKPDLSEFFRLSANSKRKPCQMRMIMEGQIQPELPPAEREQLRAALDTDGGLITAGAIVAWLKARNHESNPNRVANHRRGVCDCER